MGKLSKQQIKHQSELLDSIQNNPNDDQIETFYHNFNEQFIGDVTRNSAYFTPLDLAYDFALMSPTYGYVIDACAGIGHLSFAAKTRDYYQNNIKQLICIELNHKYTEIGKKLLPEADWYTGSIFDEELHKEIMSNYNIQKYDCLISNPPFGSYSMKPVPKEQRKWLKYTGSEFDMATIEIGHKLANNASYILPTQSCTFQASGHSYIKQHKENRKFNKLKKEINQPNLIQHWTSIDTAVYEQFKNTRVSVECLTVEVDEWT
ncbi:hypothetical protein Pla110_33170 [Polystyrenella longa]|uniref:Site-specific DNA-methyltransferase (adenine-specific) n=1 Tax=Polystyrenella longa TaxID=2528007 RepID=A0A518CQT9_9PLAN|nr:hypothetical protein [Polystyrenella longa]QDU81575.1 hypothetical protein Pla110_33170 [Polystyrenella longa]